MITLTEILLFVIVHWIADFVLQQIGNLGEKKSTSMQALLIHTSEYSLCFFILMVFLIGLDGAITFTLVTFIAHTITDYITSRLNKRLYEENKKSSLRFSTLFHIL